MKNFLRVLLTIALGLFLTSTLTSCGGGGSDNTPTATLVSIKVSPATASITSGTSQQFAATGTYTDSSTQDLTTQVTWSSSDESVATISNDVGTEGLASSASEGTTTIEASLNGISSGDSSQSALLTVTAATIVSIAITPTPTVIAVGGTRQFTATGTYTDSTTQDLTSQVTWLSSATGVVTVDSSGLATGVLAGSATLSATDPTSGISSDDTSQSASVEVKDPLSVSALYPTNGTDWNDYLKDDGTDTACDPATDTACVHGGELRSVPVTGKTDCTGLTATDSLGAFNWTCDASTNPVRMVSTGLADGKRLSDLLDFDTALWKTASVTIYESEAEYGVSIPAKWWGNLVVLDNDGSDGTDMAAGDIRIVTTNAAATYTVGADKVALVIKPGITLTGTATTSENIVSADAKSFLWFEGAIDATGDYTGFSLNTRFSALVGVSVDNATSFGVYLYGGRYNTITDTSASNSSTGVYLDMSYYNTLTNVSASNSGLGVYLDKSFYNTLTDISTSNNTSNGILLDSARYNTLTNITADNNYYGIGLNYGANDNTLTNVTASNSTYDGVFIYSSNNNSLTNVTANNNNLGVHLNSSSYNTLKNVAVSNNSPYGVNLSSSDNNIITNVTAGNNNSTGVNLSFSDNNTLTNITTSNNSTYGVFFTYSSNNTLTTVTASNNNSSGITISNSNNNTLLDVTTTNNNYGVYLTSTSNNNTLACVATANNGYGVWLWGSSYNALSDVAASNNNNYGVGLWSSSSYNTFTGQLKVGLNGTDCKVSTDGISPGLVNTTCTDDGTYGSSSYIANTSTATLYNNVTMAGSLVTKVTTDDTINTSDSDGTAYYPDDPGLFDWSGFDSPYRAWGKDGSAFPNADNQGRWTTGTGRIWDWSLATGDTGDNSGPVVLDVLAAPTGNDTLTHTWYMATAPTQQSDCDAAIAGSVFVTDHCESTFLRNAAEVQGDSIGNDNTLCETGETCLYTPNMGSYQGHGSLISAGSFTDGTLTGITLMQYETNGY